MYKVSNRCLLLLTRQLHQNPERHVEKLVRYPYYRLRVGDYGVILDIQNEMVRILIFTSARESLN